LLRREHVAALLGSKTPNVARQWLKTLRGLLQFAVETGLIKTNPTAGIRAAKPPKTEGWHSWSETEIARFEECYAIGTKPRLAMALLLYTAVRRSDLVRLGPQHISAGRISVRAQKTSRTTGKVLQIPLHPALVQVLSMTPATHLTFLVTEYGRPFTAAGFGGKFRDWCNEAGLPHCTAHGLRKAQLRRLAEAGCSEHEIQAISGHASLEEIRTYTRAVQQSRLADQAFAKVEAAFPAKPGTEDLQTSPAELTNRPASN
jgi:integrase